MKNYILTLIVIALSTIKIAIAKEHPFLAKGWVKYPPAKAQNEATFSEMLPERPLSKTNGVVLRSNTSAQVNILSEIAPSKRVYRFQYRPAIQSTSPSGNSLPKIPASKMNYFDQQLRK